MLYQNLILSKQNAKSLNTDETWEGRTVLLKYLLSDFGTEYDLGERVKKNLLWASFLFLTD